MTASEKFHEIVRLIQQPEFFVGTDEHFGDVFSVYSRDFGLANKAIVHSYDSHDQIECGAFRATIRKSSGYPIIYASGGQADLYALYSDITNGRCS